MCHILRVSEKMPCFIPGYLLTTAENELGVVIARSEVSGAKMVPVAWTEMQCPKTYNKELRKVAKVIPENLAELPENL